MLAFLLANTLPATQNYGNLSQLGLKNSGYQRESIISSKSPRQGALFNLSIADPIFFHRLEN